MKGGMGNLVKQAQQMQQRMLKLQEELAQRLRMWFDDPVRARTYGASGREAITANRGAVKRLVAMVEPLLRSPVVPPAASSAGSRRSRGCGRPPRRGPPRG